MLNSGYIFLDCGGINLSSSSAQSLSGIYNRASAALKSGKPVILTNIKFGTKASSPISATLYQYSSTVITAIASIYSIAIANTNSATVTNLTT